MTRLSIRIPKTLRKGLVTVCRQQQRPASAVVRDSLRRYIAVEKFRTLHRKFLPLAKAQRMLTDADVFKAVS
jgi:predicted transcriptional regulator